MPPGLNPDDVVLILTSPKPAAVIARELGFSHQSICDVRNNKSHKHVRPDIPRVNKYSHRRLQPDEVIYIRNSDETIGALSRKYKVSRRTILSAKRTETYRDIGLVAPLAGGEPHCCHCLHWKSGCDLGLPEALEDPRFAAECDLYST
jgi:hypothetical protein